ncbi:porin [Tabrizicola sp. BL-A-41-H6]|uniref:porin n=1 Tax=Tabrizicola sp. BL-A-41-H6 TaxID=3421107 RepID=UPI003D672E07
MKKLLLATTLLAGSAGFAAAEVTVSGDARMGVLDSWGDSDLSFSSRARVAFSMSGETDGGLAFGAALRADNSEGASGGQAGAVFISGAFGKLSMGDVDGAALMATGQVSGVGYTGLGDTNEIIYIGAGGFDDTTDATQQYTITGDPTALYEYSTGALSFYLSASEPGHSVVTPVSGDTVEGQAYAAGAKYSAGAYTVGIGFEQLSVDTNGVSDGDVQHITLGGSATFGAVTLKGIYADVGGDLFGIDLGGEQYALSADYTMDALTATAFYRKSDLNGDTTGIDIESWGLGASYDLGGGATVAGGYANTSINDIDDDAYDIGVKFSF